MTKTTQSIAHFHAVQLKSYFIFYTDKQQQQQKNNKTFGKVRIKI